MDEKSNSTQKNCFCKKGHKWISDICNTHKCCENENCTLNVTDDAMCLPINTGKVLFDICMKHIDARNMNHCVLLIRIKNNPNFLPVFLVIINGSTSFTTYDYGALYDQNNQKTPKYDEMNQTITNEVCVTHKQCKNKNLLLTEK